MLPDPFNTMTVVQAGLTLRFTGSVRFRFNHGGPVHGFLTRMCEGHPPLGIFPFAGESGRVHYARGDRYRLGMTFVGKEAVRLPGLVDRIAAAGAERWTGDGPCPVLFGNFELETVDQIVLKLAEGPARSVSEDCTLQFLSPFRRERPPHLIQPGRKAMDADCFPPDHFLQGLWSRLRRLYLDTTEGEVIDPGLPPTMPEGLRMEEARLIWIDVPHKGRPDQQRWRPHGYTLGGVQGTVRFEGLDPVWGALLQLGQILQVGEDVHHGFGRYGIVGLWDPARDPFRPACSMRELAAEPEQIRLALEHVQSSSDVPGVDGLSPRDVLDEDPRWHDSLADQFRGHRHEPSDLLGIIATKKNGKSRPLAIPTVADRCMQRAVNQVMGPAVDLLLEDCSFAYRKGFSRKHAAQAIERAYKEGYRYILETDIESFFDEVDQTRILAKFTALFPFSGLEGAIESWITAPVRYQGRVIARPRGIPQGAPISPVLANLYLDEFDEELLGKNYRLVRYSDDMVILCRDLGEAERARKDAEAAIARLGLKLSEEKTGIRTFESGFTYLGYLFAGGLVLEAKAREGKRSESAPGPEAWLAEVGPEGVKQLPESKAARNRGDRVALVKLQAVTEERNPKGEGVYLFRSDQEVHLAGDCIEVQDPGEKARTIPIREVSHLVACGRTRLTVPVLAALVRRKVPVYLCDGSGELDVAFDHQSPDYRLWLAQGKAADDPALTLGFAQVVVEAKLHNQATLVTRLNLCDRKKSAQMIRTLARGCGRQTTVQEVLGSEGQGARVFFGALAGALPAGWGFQGRRKRPPPDPVNAMLSYGYSILYQHCSTALIMAGLNPRVGLMHRERGAYHALACDLQEEIRFLVEALTWSLIRRGTASPSLFEPSRDGSFPCLMNRDMRRSFIMGLEKRLATPFQPEDWDRQVTYREFLYHQARSIRELIRGHVQEYRPLRLKA